MSDMDRVDGGATGNDVTGGAAGSGPARGAGNGWRWTTAAVLAGFAVAYAAAFGPGLLERAGRAAPAKRIAADAAAKQGAKPHKGGPGMPGGNGTILAHWALEDSPVSGKYGKLLYLIQLPDIGGGTILDATLAWDCNAQDSGGGNLSPVDVHAVAVDDWGDESVATLDGIGLGDPLLNDQTWVEGVTTGGSANVIDACGAAYGNAKTAITVCFRWDTPLSFNWKTTLALLGPDFSEGAWDIANVTLTITWAEPAGTRKAHASCFVLSG